MIKMHENINYVIKILSSERSSAAARTGRTTSLIYKRKKIRQSKHPFSSYTD